MEPAHPSKHPLAASLITNIAVVVLIFLLTRLTMSAVILGTLTLRGFEEQRFELFIVQVAVAAASILAVLHSGYVLQHRIRKGNVPELSPVVVVALDSVLAIGVMSVIEVETSPLAWVALVTPVLETAILFSLSGAALTWCAVSLAFLALRLTTSSADDMTVDTLVLAVQQVLAAISVSGPAALLADAARDRIESLATARREADQTSQRLRQIAKSAQEMTGRQTVEEILSVACESAAAIGFMQADAVVRDGSGTPFVRSTFASGSVVNLPADLLMDSLEDSVGSLSANDPAFGDALRLKNVGSGHAIEISSSSGDRSPKAVLRVWSADISVSAEDLQLLALLGGHAREAYRAAELLQRAERHADQLLYEVRHDALTGLANRSFVLETLTDQLSNSVAVALLFIDLDGFKAINDTLGHHAGDDALCEVARRLEQTIQNDALAGRMGGDEFVVLTPLTRFENKESLLAFSDGLVDAIRQPMVVAGKAAQLGASIGVAVHQPGVSADQLISLADTAMYEAKRSGGGTNFRDRVSPQELRSAS